MIVQHEDIVLVGLPREATMVSTNGSKLLCLSALNVRKYIDLPPGFKYTLIGIHSKDKPLSEEECGKVIKRVVIGYLGNFYQNYVVPSLLKTFSTATESFASLLSYVKMYLENPYGEKEPQRNQFYEVSEMQSYINATAYDAAVKQWQEAQQRTFPQIAALKKSEDKKTKDENRISQQAASKFRQG